LSDLHSFLVEMSYASLKSKVDQFFQSPYIVVIDVSGSDPSAAANINFDKLTKEGFHVIPVNPRLKTFHVHTCYPSVEQLPHPVGAALIFTSPKVTEEVVSQCIRVGVANIWIHQGVGQGSKNKTATQLMTDHPEVNFIDGACPMMFVNHADWIHKGVKTVMKWTGSLPA